MMERGIEEWIIGNPHHARPWCDAPIEVWTGTSTRRVQMLDGWYRYLDCWHPMQNTICDIDQVQAWRFMGLAEWAKRIREAG